MRLAVNNSLVVKEAVGLWSCPVGSGFGTTYSRNTGLQILLFEHGTPPRTVGSAILGGFTEGRAYLTDLPLIPTPFKFLPVARDSAFLEVSNKSFQLFYSRMPTKAVELRAYAPEPVDRVIPKSLVDEVVLRMSSRCQMTSLTSTTVEVVLIRPVAEGGRLDVDNCLLLSAPIAQSFARFSLTVGIDRRILVDLPSAGGLVSQFNANGYLWMPTGVSDAAHSKNFVWHCERFNQMRGWPKPA